MPLFSSGRMFIANVDRCFSTTTNLNNVFITVTCLLTKTFSRLGVDFYYCQVSLSLRCPGRADRGHGPWSNGSVCSDGSHMNRGSGLVTLNAVNVFFVTSLIRSIVKTQLNGSIRVMGHVSHRSVVCCRLSSTGHLCTDAVSHV